MLTISGRTGRADDDFLDDLLAQAPWIIRVDFFTFASIGGANKRVGHRTVGVLLAAFLHDKVLARSTGRDDALTQLTAEHGNEPMISPSGWLISR